MSLNIMIAFWGVSILFVMTPGIDWAYAISSGIQGKRVLPAVTGLLTGHLMAALIVAAGVGTLVTSQPVLLQVLTGVGAVYLLWMGLSLSMRPASISSDQVVMVHSRRLLEWLKSESPAVIFGFIAALYRPESSFVAHLSNCFIGGDSPHELCGCLFLGWI